MEGLAYGFALNVAVVVATPSGWDVCPANFPLHVLQFDVQFSHRGGVSVLADGYAAGEWWARRPRHPTDHILRVYAFLQR